MRIRSNVAPTPIVMAQQNQPDAQPAPESAPIAVEIEPMVVDLGNKQIHLSPGEMVKVVDKMNQTARVFNQSLQFEMVQGKRMVIRVIDTVSRQVVREIPPERMLDAFAQMEDALGLLLDMKL